MLEKKFKEYGKHDSTQSQNWNILHLSNNSVATLPSRPEIQTTPWGDKCLPLVDPLMGMDGMNPSGLPYDPSWVHEGEKTCGCRAYSF